MRNEAEATPDLRGGAPSDVDACVAIWVAACADRDGQAFDGVADRARPKFDRSIGWLLAVRAARIDGFVLATRPGSGMPTDPPDAAVVSLLAVAPGRQTRGLGRTLLRAVTQHLSASGYARAVLHALVDNRPAVSLYESEGWRPVGDEYEHALLKRPLRTYERLL
ncbi:GNAT family N-acetyltransferase [Curtobacterium ammoniigenes]|uniref:GNAT family N-acetyltransferase n=1 Tax=Curtobacterium ammoniigenes TaxID=395387 RepID=UPI0014703E08|nr:GNAT family N-acetyltransferase [Curtobacterium ammoniigenes]